MGGWLGAKLAVSGNDVRFIARGAHLEALRANGLRVSGADSIHLTKVIATDRPEEIGTVDVVLFCVKLYDTESAASALAPLLGPETFVVTIQNGVESAGRISSITIHRMANRPCSSILSAAGDWNWKAFPARWPDSADRQASRLRFMPRFTRR